MSKLKLGIPSKGRLMESTIEWLTKSGLAVTLPQRIREYSAAFDNFSEVEIIFLSAAEIPQELAIGKIDLGITGQDLIQEKIPEWQRFAVELKLLNFGRANLVLAVPKFWVDVDSIDDLDLVATSFRRRHLHRLRIATKYHNLVWSYLRLMGVADYQLVDSQGATEGSIKSDNAEVVADITSSGQTLDANHLKVIGDEPILRSQATLYLSRSASFNSEKMLLLEEMSKKLNFNLRQATSLKDS